MGIHREKSALELAAEVQNRRLSPTELMQDYIANIVEKNTALNAYSWLPKEDLLAEAEKLTQQWSDKEKLPRFFGVPIPIKELTEVQGWPAHKASNALTYNLGSYDAHSVACLRQAGFVLAGQTCSPEFGLLPVTHSQRNGLSRNPWNLDHTCGGSSGGAAAAVAAGIASIAHGSDGGGSLRIPASSCGLFALKASRGRISNGPIKSDSFFGFVTDGVLTKSVADSAVLLDILSQPDPYAWTTAPRSSSTYEQILDETPEKLTIAVSLDNPVGPDVAKECCEATLLAANKLEKMGHKIVDKKPHWEKGIHQATQDFMTIWSTSLASYPVKDWSLVEPFTRQFYQQAQSTCSYDFMQALSRLQVFSRKILESWETFDVLLTPTLGLEPPPCEWLFEDPKTSIEKMMQWTPFTMWFNLTGQPAASFPVALSASKLPLGVQLVGPPWREDLLFQLARGLEKELPIQLAP